MDIPFYMLLSRNDALVRNAEVVTNNIANAETKGYKQRNLYFHSLVKNNGDKRLKGTNSYPYDSYIKYDDTNGPISYTMSKMDFMFDKPNCYFGVRTKHGIRYSRNGEFHLTREGVLVDNIGNEVLSRDSASIVIESENFEIDKQGAVYVEGALVANIGFFQDNGRSIKKARGNSLYSFDVLTDEGKIDEGILLPIDVNAQVTHGALEESNVSPIDQMTNLVKINKSIEQINALYSDVANKLNKDVVNKLIGSD